MAEKQQEAGNDNLDAGKKQEQAAAAKGGQGDLPERKWMEALSEPLRLHKGLSKFTDENPIEQLAKSYVELEGKLGKSAAIPEANASEEEWDRFYSRVGRPSKADEYDVPADKVDKEFAVKYRDRAFKTGASKKQASELLQAFIEHSENSVRTAEAAHQRALVDTEQALKKEFGDKYPGKMKAFEVGIKAMFPDKTAKSLEGFRADADFVKSIIAYGEKFGETEFLHGDPAKRKAQSYEESHSYMEKYKSPRT